MADSKITKLEWSDTVKYVQRGQTLPVEINNSFFTFTPDSKPRAFGRKPYLISKEYVAPGEPYDYLAMMNTEWDLGANNAWVVNRKPYKFKDYHLMTTGYDVIGEPVEQFYPSKVYLVGFNEFSKGLVVSSVSNVGATTIAYLTASNNASGVYYLYAEDGKGNKIYTIVACAVPAIYDATPLSGGSYYRFDELLLGNLVTCTPNEYIEVTQPWLTPMAGSYTFYPASWSNANGNGTDYYYTYSLSNGEFISTLYTYSFASVSYIHTEYNYSGTQMGVTTPPYMYNKREHISIDGEYPTNVFTTSLSYVTFWYTYSGASLPSVRVSVTAYTDSRYATGYSYEPLTQKITGTNIDYQYANDDLYVYTAAEYTNYPTSFETVYSGMYDASAFNTSVMPFWGTTVQFYYV